MENPMPDTHEPALVHIVAGGINTGKTKKLLSIYHEIGRGDGFVSLKVFDAGAYIGQKIVRLSTGESEGFSFKEGYIPTGWDEECRYDAYRFSKKGLAFAHKIIADILEKGISPIFLDEIGVLELQKKGFYDLFAVLLKTKKPIYVAVRSSLVESVIHEFGIKNYEIIEVSAASGI